MKFGIDKKYLKICLYAFVTAAALLLFYQLLQASDDIWKSLVNGFNFLLELLSPFIAAVILAYILSPAVTGFDKLLSKVFKKDKHVKVRKLSALVAVYLATVSVIVITLYYVIPGIVHNINDLLINWDSYSKSLEAFYKNLQETYPLLKSSDVQTEISNQLKQLGDSLKFTVGGILNFVFRLGSSVASGILGLVLSFYLLNEREHILESFRRFLSAWLGGPRSTSLMNFLDAVDGVFGRYISAKLLLALIMFVISFIALSFLGVRYVVLMAAIVGVTTLVPYLGPFIGAVPPIIVALLDSPQKAIYTAIAILVIHQVDNYVFEPLVFSDRMGLSPFWILLSIIVGGGLFGLWGVLLAVPVAGVIKLFITRFIRIRQVHRQRQQSAGDAAPR